MRRFLREISVHLRLVFKRKTLLYFQSLPRQDFVPIRKNEKFIPGLQ